MYRPAPGTKAYRLTRKLHSGYSERKFFPATEDGLANAMRAWKRGGRNHRGRQYGSIVLVDIPSSGAGK